jgi:hypothetical protein
MKTDIMFTEQIKDKLTEKGLSPSSITLYLRNLQKLNDDLPFKNFKFLESPDNIVKKLENYKPNTQRGYFISIVATLNTMKDNNKKIEKLANEYYQLMISKNKEIKAKPQGEMSEQQKDNWVKWDAVEEKINELKEKVDKFINNKVINETQYNILLSFMVLALYYYAKPRRNQDYMKMNIVYKFNEKLSDDKNYLDYTDSKFVFNVYKTAKKEGQQEINYNEELKNVINMYLKHHPIIKGKMKKTTNEPFLVYANSNPFSTVNSITRILNKVFGKNVGSSMLRHSRQSYKYGEVIKQMGEDAKEMGHTLQTQIQDYVKDEAQLNSSDDMTLEKVSKVKKTKTGKGKSVAIKINDLLKDKIIVEF